MPVQSRRPAALHAASQVPVFAILIKEEGKLYGGPRDDQGVQPAMVYTQLEDAQRVMGKLSRHEATPMLARKHEPSTCHM